MSTVNTAGVVKVIRNPPPINRPSSASSTARLSRIVNRNSGRASIRNTKTTIDSFSPFQNNNVNKRTTTRRGSFNVGGDRRNNGMLSSSYENQRTPPPPSYGGRHNKQSLLPLYNDSISRRPSSSTTTTTSSLSTNNATFYDYESAKTNKFKSHRSTIHNKGYDFSNAKNSGILLGVSIREHEAVLKRSFIWVALVILTLEFFIFAWGVTAVAIWHIQAIFNIIWIFNLVRVILLAWAVLTSGTMAMEKMWGLGDYSMKNFYRIYGSFQPSSSLTAWSTTCFIIGVLIGGIAIITSAALYVFYDSLLLYILTVCIGIVGIIESFMSPFILYTYGIYHPVLKAKTIELHKINNSFSWNFT